MNIEFGILEKVVLLLGIIIPSWTIIKWLIVKIFGRNKKEISYYSKFIKIIDRVKDFNNDLKIYWKEKIINDNTITITDYTMCNSGSEVIHRNDIAKLTIKSSSNTVILNAFIHDESDDTNKSKIREIKDNLVTIDFDYLDANEFTKIRIWHTGSNDTLKVNGKIKGGVVRNLDEQYKSKYINEMEIFKWYFISIGIIIFLKALVDEFNILTSFFNLILLLSLMISWIVLYILLIRNAYLSIKARIPRKLRKDYESKNFD